jgi:hypothetical protein
MQNAVSHMKRELMTRQAACCEKQFPNAIRQIASPTLIYAGGLGLESMPVYETL